MALGGPGLGQGLQVTVLLFMKCLQMVGYEAEAPLIFSGPVYARLHNGTNHSLQLVGNFNIYAYGIAGDGNGQGDVSTTVTIMGGTASGSLSVYSFDSENYCEITPVDVNSQPDDGITLIINVSPYGDSCFNGTINGTASAPNNNP